MTADGLATEAELLRMIKDILCSIDRRLEEANNPTCFCRHPRSSHARGASVCLAACACGGFNHGAGFAEGGLVQP